MRTLHYVTGEEGFQVLPYRLLGLRGFTGLDREARGKRAERGIRLHLGRIEVEFAAPHQPRLPALFQDRIEEAAKDLHPVARADARQARMVRQRFI
jgi:hypothetical protein